MWIGGVSHVSWGSLYLQDRIVWLAIMYCIMFLMAQNATVMNGSQKRPSSIVVSSCVSCVLLDVFDKQLILLAVKAQLQLS